jgi:hypothetical protein
MTDFHSLRARRDLVGLPAWVRHHHPHVRIVDSLG